MRTRLIYITVWQVTNSPERENNPFETEIKPKRNKKPYIAVGADNALLSK